jgi:glycine cleavage system aminomethyltransferase T
MSLENDGSRTPAELRLGHLADTGRGAFTGAAALQKAALAETARPRLFGVLLDEAGLVVPPGTHLLSDPDSHPARVQGHITSSGFSPTLHRALALGFADSGLNEGDRIFVQHFGEARPGRLVNPHFLEMEERP